MRKQLTILLDMAVQRPEASIKKTLNNDTAQEKVRGMKQLIVHAMFAST
jgi:hypothetical protein